MPVMSGHGITRTIKQDERLRHIPVNMLTVRAEITDEIKDMEFGAAFLLSRISASREKNPHHQEQTIIR
jgi:CheY-like chemotaxis protein